MELRERKWTGKMRGLQQRPRRDWLMGGMTHTLVFKVFTMQVIVRHWRNTFLPVRLGALTLLLVQRRYTSPKLSLVCWPISRGPQRGLKARVHYALLYQENERFHGLILPVRVCIRTTIVAEATSTTYLSVVQYESQQSM